MTTKPIEYIESDDFIQWLETQPKDREFSRRCDTNCPIWHYLTEARGLEECVVREAEWWAKGWGHLPNEMPVWAANFVHEWDRLPCPPTAENAIIQARQSTLWEKR